MIDDNGLSIITVRKDELLAALKKNRDSHRDIFIQAQKGFREAFIAELDRNLHDAREGRAYRKTVVLIEPQDHTRDYDRVIRMLEMSVASEAKITESEFSKYVLDDWGWKGDFVASTSNYLNNR